MPRLRIRNVSVLIVPEEGECRVDESQDIDVDNGLIIAITPTRGTADAGERDEIDGTGLLAVEKRLIGRGRAT